MILYDDKGNEYPAKAASRPRFSQHRGRTWDSDPKTVNGSPVAFHYDSTWGFNYYFKLGDRWYSLRHFDGHRDRRSWDATEVREFYTTRPQVSALAPSASPAPTGTQPSP